MGQLERHAKQRDKIAQDAAEQLRQQQALRPTPLAVYVRMCFPPAPQELEHANRYTYLAGLLPQTEVAIGRTGAQQAELDAEHFIRAAARAFVAEYLTPRPLEQYAGDGVVRSTLEAA